MLKVEAGEERLYSIDVYKLLEEKGSCEREISEGNVTLCTRRLSLCEAVIAVVGGRAELISLRLRVKASQDPAGGDMAKAREICMKEAGLL
ncbi:MAG: hypothetical protein N3F67_04935 [Acidilobaceae archaeon]|nr:hypothetical protein [Acidilobaceae archaeon]